GSLAAAGARSAGHAASGSARALREFLFEPAGNGETGEDGEDGAEDAAFDEAAPAGEFDAIAGPRVLHDRDDDGTAPGTGQRGFFPDGSPAGSAGNGVAGRPDAGGAGATAGDRAALPPGAEPGVAAGEGAGEPAPGDAPQ